MTSHGALVKCVTLKCTLHVGDITENVEKLIQLLNNCVKMNINAAIGRDFLNKFVFGCFMKTKKCNNLY